MNPMDEFRGGAAGAYHRRAAQGINFTWTNPPAGYASRNFEDRRHAERRMLRRLDAVIDYAAALPAPPGIRRIWVRARKDEDGMVTCGWALLHALEHAYLHLGHVS